MEALISHIASVFLNTKLPWCRASCLIAFVWKTTQGTIFGKCFCLLGGEYPFVGKTACLFCTLFVTNVVVVIAIFSKLLFQFIMFPSVPPLSEGEGEREKLECV